MVTSTSFRERQLSMNTPNKITQKTSSVFTPVPQEFIDKITLYADSLLTNYEKGSGYVNLGNTCFMNSVLQCVLGTPQIKYFMSALEKYHSPCSGEEFCALCGLYKLHSLHATERIAPANFAFNLSRIAPHFSLGQQQDAHEFYVFLLDALHKCIAKKYSNLQEKQVITLFNQVFGGYTETQMICQNCENKSNTVELFLDLSLSISNSEESIIESIDKISAPEIISHYTCLRCKSKDAQGIKLQSIKKFPQALALHINRFTASGAKIDDFVAYPPTLDLSHLGNTEENKGQQYQLYGMIIHNGETVHSGHYYSMVKNLGTNQWFVYNDEEVYSVEESKALMQKPYMLFYKKCIASNLASSAKTTERISETSQNPKTSSKALMRPNSNSTSIQSTTTRSQQTMTPGSTLPKSALTSAYLHDDHIVKPKQPTKHYRSDSETSDTGNSSSDASESEGEGEGQGHRRPTTYTQHRPRPTSSGYVQRDIPHAWRLGQGEHNSWDSQLLKAWSSNVHHPWFSSSFFK